MTSELDDFIQQHKAKLAQERENLQQIPQDTPPNQQRRTWQKTPVGPINVYKENVPPKSPDEVGLIGKMTDSEARQKRLREERNNEYNQLLRRQQRHVPQQDVSTPLAPAPVMQRNQQKEDGYHATLPGLGNNDEAERRKITERNREYNEFLRQPQSQQRNRTLSDTPQLEEFDQWSRDKPPPPRKGWATPTYDEILNQKRQEERNYRRQIDADYSDGDARLGNADYKRNSASDGQLNHAIDRRDNRLRNVDEDYDPRKVRFMGIESSYPRTDPQPRRAQQRNFLEHSEQPDSLAALPPRSQRTQKNNEHFNATLLIGKDPRESDDRRRKAEYREELKRQIEEAATNKRRGHVGVVQPMPVDDMEPESYPQQRQYSNRGPTAQTTMRQPPRNLPNDLPSADDFGLRFGASAATSYMPPESLLANGFNYDHLSRPGYPTSYPSAAHVGYAQPVVTTNQPLNLGSVAPSAFVAAQPVAPGMYRSPMDDAYYYYGLQNPLDPGLGTAAFVPAQQPVPQFNRSTHAPPVAVRTNGYGDYGGQTQPPPSQRNAPVVGDALRGRGEYDEKQAAAGDKKRLYQLELQKQMEEDNRRKQKEKEAREAYERKLEDEIRNYSPYGRGGGGAPLKDAHGNVITLRRGQADQQKPPETGRRAPAAPVPEPGNPWQPLDTAAVQYEPTHRMQMSDHPEVGSGDADFGHARGGNGIFGEPISDEQKNSRMKYQDELRKQIEERKQREREEKEKAAREEELLMKRIEEENIRIKQQEAEEKQKAREKQAEADRRQQELLEQQERSKKEAEQKRREADEARLEQFRKQEERRRAEETQRADSRMLNVQNERVPGNRQSQHGQSSRLGQSSSPAPRPASNTITTRVPSAEVMGHLARMKEQLRSERQRLELNLERERMEPVVFDPRAAAQAAPATYDVDVVRVGSRRPTVTRRVLPENSPRVDNSRNPKSRDARELETQQNVRLAQQEEQLRQLRMDRGFQEPRFSDEPPGRHSRALNNGDILESESDFIAIPPSSSRADIRTDLDDLARQRNNNSRNRRRQRLESNPMGSLASLNPDELEERNQSRLRRLKSLAGDDISTGDPDSILQKFMSKANHNRPPSSYTLEDESWMNANSGR